MLQCAARRPAARPAGRGSWGSATARAQARFLPKPTVALAGGWRCPPVRIARGSRMDRPPHRSRPRMTEGGGRVHRAGHRLAIPRDGPPTLRPLARPMA